MSTKKWMVEFSLVLPNWENNSSSAFAIVLSRILIRIKMGEIGVRWSRELSIFFSGDWNCSESLPLICKYSY